LVSGARQPKYGAYGFGSAEASWHVDRGAIGERHYRANAWRSHQASAHLIIAHNSEQPAMQNSHLLAQHPPD
jgi:hypothetical protein